MPFLSTIAAGLVTAVPFYAIYQRRHSRSLARESRVEATCDAVLGQSADPNEGRWVASPGMKERLDGMRGSLERIEASQSRLSDDLARHIADDQRRFEALEEPPGSGAIKGVRR